MLKSIMISFASIIGVLLILMGVWLFALKDDPRSLANNQEVDPTTILEELQQENMEELAQEEPEFEENIEFFKSNLKIISIE